MNIQSHHTVTHMMHRRAKTPTARIEKLEKEVAALQDDVDRLSFRGKYEPHEETPEEREARYLREGDGH